MAIGAGGDNLENEPRRDIRDISGKRVIGELGKFEKGGTFENSGLPENFGNHDIRTKTGHPNKIRASEEFQTNMNVEKKNGTFESGGTRNFQKIMIS